MKITYLTLFPEMFMGFKDTSIVKKAVLKGLVELEFVDIRSFTQDKNLRVDDYPFGGGAGLVMMCQPVLDAIRSCRMPNSHVIYMSPQGQVFKQADAQRLKRDYEHLILLCGHYEGIDERILSEVDEQISIGDYVLTGGEVPAMVVSDAVIRLVDGVITAQSHEDDSFSDGLLEYPQYTRPRVYEGMEVPEILLSGNHGAVDRWRHQMALKKTRSHRPDLLNARTLSLEEIELLEEDD